jgi:anti-sigma factor RsiW
MDCRDFWDRYSEFADGLLDEAAEGDFRRHLSGCPSCRRLDSAYHAGQSALCEMPQISPSCEFRRHLVSRLHRARREPALRQWSGIAGAALLVAAAGVAALEFRPAALRRSVVADTPPASNAVPASPRSRLVVTFGGDSSFSYPYHFPVIAVPRDSGHTPAAPAASFAVAVDWIGP